MDNVAIPCLMINAPIQNIKEEQKNSGNNKKEIKESYIILEVRKKDNPYNVIKKEHRHFLIQEKMPAIFYGFFGNRKIKQW